MTIPEPLSAFGRAWMRAGTALFDAAAAVLLAAIYAVGILPLRLLGVGRAALSPGGWRPVEGQTKTLEDASRPY